MSWRISSYFSSMDKVVLLYILRSSSRWSSAFFRPHKSPSTGSLAARPRAARAVRLALPRAVPPLGATRLPGDPGLVRQAVGELVARGGVRDGGSDRQHLIEERLTPRVTGQVHFPCSPIEQKLEVRLR